MMRADTPVMNGLSDAVRDATDRLSELEKKRESAISASRIITRKTKNMIHAIHLGDGRSSMEKGLLDDVGKVLEELGDEPSVFYSSVLQDALGEYAEAFIFASMVEGDAIPSYQSLRITPQAWVLGLADSIGEVRRMILAYLMDGRLEDARNLFERMEELGDEILGIDVPDAIVPVRRKQDVARSIIEKTRSDIANAVMLAQMKK